jgi:hypothetical protein
MVESKSLDAANGKPLAGLSFAFFGNFAYWPKYHGQPPAAVACRLGATLQDKVDTNLHYLVIGDKRGTGRAEARKRAKRLIAKHSGSPDFHLQILDEAAYREMVRMEVQGKTFAFCGGFDCCPGGFDDGLLAGMVHAVDGIVQDHVDENIDFLVEGNRRCKGKTAALRIAHQLEADHHPIVRLSEEGFLELVRKETPADSGEEMSFATLMSNLYGVLNEKKIQRAIKMLQKERFQLYSHINEENLIGVVRSQTEEGTIYSPFLESTGHYGCATPDFEGCMGLQGEPCKHLMVLVLGLVHSGEFPAQTAWEWIRGSSSKRPVRREELTTDALLQYKGVVEGEVDWRPTETMPEDFM